MVLFYLRLVTKKMNNMFLNRNTIFIVLLILLFSVEYSKPTLAQNHLSNHEQKKLEDMVATIKKDQKASKIWWNSWLGIYTVGTIVQTGIAIQTDNLTLKQDMYLGAATTLLGAGAQLFTPIVRVNQQLFDNLENMNEEQRSKMLQEANILLEKCYAFEKNGQSWKNHALTGVVNIGGGLITWLGFHRTVKDGLINFAINTVITEAQIWSQPLVAKKAYLKYCEQLKTGYHQTIKPLPITFSASANAMGFQLRMIF